MSKQVSYSHISHNKTEFDAIYNTNINNSDPTQLQKTVERMIQLQDQINYSLDQAPVKIFGWFIEPTIDVKKTKLEVQDKLAVMIARHESLISSGKSVTPIYFPTSSAQQVHTSASDLAVGFENLSANCWANSLLSMLLSMPSFRRAYETVANHYVHDYSNQQNQIHGQALLNALNAYDTALMHRTAVPSSVSQDVRLAFHHFFGYRNPVTTHEVFSQQSSCQEDASEGMLRLMGRYEDIMRQTGHLNGPYSLLETKRFYRPIGQEQPAVRNDYSRLSNGNVSSTTNHDYQILLDLQNKGHLSFSELISEYFRSTQVQGNDAATYLLPNGNVQQFELIGESRQFVNVPDELLLTVKRFGANMAGEGYKIATPLAVQQRLVLPAEATQANTPVVYELDTFNVHSGGFGGGHYIAYRKINGQWIEANDGAVRFVSEQEIDQILFGQWGTYYTCYMHHYTRVSAVHQQTAAPSPVPVIPTPLNSQTEPQHEQTLKLIESLNTPSANLSTSLKELEKTAPEVAKTFQHAIWLNDKTPDVPDYGSAILSNNPGKLQEIRHPWLISSLGHNLVEQMLNVQRRKREIAEEKHKVASLRELLEKAKSSAISNELLRKALIALPDGLKNSLHGLVYQSHLKKFGPNHVNKEEYKNAYGRHVIENGDLKQILTESAESILNPWGKNILEQLIESHRLRVAKLEYAYEKEQLQALHELMLRPLQEISNYQLFKAFERLEIRNELREKLYWHIWHAHREPPIPNYGSNTFKENPRCVLGICEPNLARPPVCEPGANILLQMIKLLERDSKP